jgi:hypothetical protein
VNGLEYFLYNFILFFKNMANLHRIEASYLDSHETALGPGKGSHATRALLEHF